MFLAFKCRTFDYEDGCFKIYSSDYLIGIINFLSFINTTVFIRYICRNNTLPLHARRGWLNYFYKSSCATNNKNVLASKVNVWWKWYISKTNSEDAAVDSFKQVKMKTWRKCWVAAGIGQINKNFALERNIFKTEIMVTLNTFYCKSQNDYLLDQRTECVVETTSLETASV